MTWRKWWKLGSLGLIATVAIAPSGCAASRQARQVRQAKAEQPVPPPVPDSWLNGASQVTRAPAPPAINPWQPGEESSSSRSHQTAGGPQRDEARTLASSATTASSASHTTPATPAAAVTPEHTTLQQVAAVEPLGERGEKRVERIAFTAAQPAPLPSTGPPPPPGQAASSTHHATHTIDLPTALRLAQGDNLQVAFARAQIAQAWSKYDAARVMWLPSIRAGIDYNKHDAQIQDITGNVFPASRGNVWSGLGAGTPGAGSPAFPGVYMNFHLADALFEPLAAQQAAFARRHAADAVANDVLWRVSLGYFELVRAAQEVAIARDVEATARQLVKLTGDHAAAGQGSAADADRATAEWSVRRNDVLRAQESLRVASARLSQLLRLDICVQLEPLDPLAVPIDLLPCELSCCELVTWGLSNRPELAQHRHLVTEAVERMRRQQYSVLMPSVVLGASYGVFGGGQGQDLANFGNRFDGDAIAYWQLRNLGFGDAAARSEARSQVRQANVAQMAIMDQICREVIEAQAQVESRRGQIEIAREGIAAAERSQSRNLERIRNLQGLPLEMLQSNQALAQARREYLRAVIDYNSAQVTLYHALGAPGGMPALAQPTTSPGTGP